MLTYNVKLKLSEIDKEAVIQMLEAERLAWNYASKTHFNSRKNSIVTLHRKFYKKFRQEYPEIPANIVIRAMNSVLSAYRSVKSNKHKIISAPVKNRLSIRLRYHLYKLKENQIKLSTLHRNKRVTGTFDIYPKLAEMFSKYRVCDPLLFERNGEIWIAFPFDNPAPPVSDGKILGVDLGINRFMATNEGKIYKTEPYNARKRRIRHLKSSLKAKGTRSAKKHLKKVSSKETNMTRNFIHLMVNEILNSGAKTIVIENLQKLKEKCKKKNKSYNNKLFQVPFRLFRDILIYKAQARGIRVVIVNPAFTSQKDHRGLKRGKRVGSRYYARDGKVLDADVNAACNIAKKSKLPVSYGNVLDGQVAVIRPIVCKPNDFTQVRSDVLQNL